MATDERTQHVMWETTRRATSTYEDLLYYNGSYQLREEIAATGQIITRVPYKPTNWAKSDSDREWFDGANPNATTCTVCFMVRAWNGACSIDCPGDESGSK